ncbi:MAG: hypothetical protein R3E76_03530 [Planctomycetota bacterium]
MTTPLTEEQRELLSAYLDGEVTDAERQTAETLLKREDAQQYLESLQATADLVMKHASIKAPVGLSGRVMTELQKDLKPKAGKVHTLPTVSWQTPLWAAAAVVVLSLAVMFGPSLLSVQSTPDSDVARSVLDNLPQGSSDPILHVDPPVSGKPEGTLKDGTNDENFARGGGSGGRTLERFRHDGDAELGAAEGMAEEAEKSAETLDKLNKELRRASARDGQSPAEDAVDEVPDAESAEPNDAPKMGGGTWGPADPTTEDEREQGKRTADGSSPPTPPSQPQDDAARNGETKKAKEADKTERTKGENTGGDADDAGNDDLAKKDYGAPGNDAKLPEGQDRKSRNELEEEEKDNESQPESSPNRRAGESNAAALEIQIADGATLQGQTDVLWVSSLYGDATIADSDNDEIESISVEIEQDKLPQLMAALQKLAVDQGYGKVDGGSEVPGVLEPAGAEHEARISGYLPTDSKAKDANATESAPEPNPEPGKEAPAKVTVIIRLK